MTLRDARRDAGLSQAELAERAGISRQAVGAIEAGRHRPGVDAAMALASAVGRSVEELFAAPATAPAPVFGPVADGGGVLAARVGGRLVYAPARDALAVEGWPRANAVMRDGRPEPLPGSDLDGLVLVGCDPALGLAAAMLPGSGPHRLVALSGSTATALAAMRDGRAHAALVHGPARGIPSPPAGALRIHLARWRVGVASRGRRPRPLAALARVVQREEGASSQKAFAAALAAEGAPLPPGPVASGHLDVARRVAYGAPAGVTMEPAAIGMELAFAPLEEHVAEVWIDARAREHPAAGAIGELLRSGAFTRRLGLVGGYDLDHCGERSDA
jgi:transcriptional regulator with XRE-family HTH domain